MKKKTLSLIMVCIMAMSLFTLVPISASAAIEGYYTYTVSNGEATITNVNTSISGAVTIPSTLGGYPVTTIGARAFSYASLTSIRIPNGVTTIGDSAFFHCASLKSAVMGDSVTTIGDSAFFDCDSLTSVVIPDSVNIIGNSAFYGCNSLTSIVMGDSVASIGDFAFYWCKSLTSIVIPNSVTTIGDSVFYKCGNLTTVVIGDSVTSIGDEVFYECYNLISVVMGDSVTIIGDEAFRSCTSLRRVEIPDSTITIGDNAFYNCNNLTSVVMGDSITTIGDFAFYYCNRLTSVVMGDNVTTIGDSAFCMCDSLKRVVIGDKVTTIGDNAFWHCYNLTSIEIPDSVTTIGKSAFGYCDSLTSIEIPDSVTTIGTSAFDKCNNLKDIYYTGSEAEWKKISIGLNNEGLSNATIHYNYVDKSDGASAGKTESTTSKDTGKLNLAIYENKNDSSNVKDSYILSDGAVVTNRNGTVAANFKGLAVIKDNGGDITVSKKGFLSRTVSAKRAKKLKSIHLQKDTGVKPVIQAVWVEDTDIYNHDFEIDITSKDAVIMTAEIVWKSGSESKIYLMQEGKKVNFIGNTLKTVLSDNFDVAKDIYIVAEDTKGNVTQKKLKIKADGGVANALDDYKLSFGDSVTGTIPSNIPVIGGGKVGLDIPFIPLTVTFEDNKFYAVLGLDVAKASEQYSFIKNVNGSYQENFKQSTKYLCENIKDSFTKSADKYNFSKLKSKWKKSKI